MILIRIFVFLFLLKVCTYAVVTSSCLVWFLIFDLYIYMFLKLNPLHDTSAMAKGGLEAVCNLREWPGSTMMVPRDNFQCNVTRAATKTDPKY
jgi:hypothetical protein